MLYASSLVISHLGHGDHIPAHIHNLLTIVEHAEFQSSGKTDFFLAMAGHLLSQYAYSKKSLQGIDVDSMWKFGKSSPILLKGIADYLQLHEIVLDGTNAFSELVMNIGSLQTPLRRETLRILSLLSPLDYIKNENDSYTGPCQIFRHLLELEETPCDGTRTRDKTVLFRRLDALTECNCIPKEYQDVIASYSFATFSINFAPIWADAIQTLVLCSKKDYYLFRQLFLFNFNNRTPENIPQFYTAAATPEYSHDNRLVCSNLLEIEDEWIKSVSSFADSGKELSIMPLRELSVESDRFDQMNYFSLMLKALSATGLVEKISRDVVPDFITLVSSEMETDNARKRVLAYLGLFSTVKKPRKMYQAEQLYSIFLRTVANGDNLLQSKALECLLTWQYPGIVENAAALKAMSVDSSFRDALSTFDIDSMRIIPAEQQDRLIQILVRLLYGKITSRKGRNSSKSGLHARRAAIFDFLARLSEKERNYMLDLMIEPFSNDGKHAGQVPFNKQMGFLTVLKDVVKQLRTLIVPMLPRIFPVLINILKCADLKSKDSDDSMLPWREVRQEALKRVLMIFSAGLDFDYEIYMPSLFEYLAPKISSLPLENTQNSSTLLLLLSAWSQNERYLGYLCKHDIVPQVLTLISGIKVDYSVVQVVIAMIESIQDISDASGDQRWIPLLFGDHMPLLLQQMDQVLSIQLESASIKNESLRIIRVLSRISPFVTTAPNAQKLVTLLLPFLKKPSKKVPESTKHEILTLFLHFMLLLSDDYLPSTLPLMSQLFALLETHQCRLRLVEIIAKYPESCELKRIAPLLVELHAVSTKRIDEPDFNRRFDAFSIINQKLYEELMVTEWRVLIYQLVYSLQDPEEYSIRTSAALGIERFLSKKDVNFEPILLHILLPAIKKGLRHQVVAIRQEFVQVLSKLINWHQDLPAVTDLVHLLANGDDEQNFFSNILHMQSHRRMRALKNLVGWSQTVSSSNTHTILMPLVSHFIFESDRVTDHNMINEAVSCLASLTGRLKWGQYYNALKNYMSAIEIRPELEKILIRLLVSMLDQFRFPMSATVDSMEIDSLSSTLTQSASTVEEITADGENDENDEDHAEEAKVEVTDNQLPFRIYTAVTERLVPRLQKLMAHRDDETVPNRVPLATPIVKLLLTLPELLQSHLARLLQILVNILTSMLQSARDAAKDTLVEVSKLLGPKYLSYILSSIKATLRRGYQLHVQGHVLYAIMAANAESYQGKVSSCIFPIVDMLMLDVFGEPSKERQVKEMCKMREMKSSRGLETFQILGQILCFESLPTVLRPIRAMMLESTNPKVITHIKDVLKSVSLGLITNQPIEMTELMVFTHQLMSETLPMCKPEKAEKVKLSTMEKNLVDNFTVKTKQSMTPIKTYEVNAHLFIEFGMELLLSSIKRERIDLKSQSHLQMMDPLLEMLAKAMYSNHNLVVILAIRIFSTLKQAQLPSMAQVIPLVVRRLFQIISKTNHSDSELIQSAFKLLTIILREMPDVPIPDNQLLTLLAVLEPELERSENQTTTFSLVRALLSRQLMAVQVYDLMDKVARVMVTNPQKPIRDLCRQCYIQFLLTYPHGPVRMRKQMAYLVNNLSYEHETGRISVLDLIQLIARKFSEEEFLNYADMLFLSLVMTLANDSSSECREMAGTTIQSIFQRLGLNRIDNMMNILSKWSLQSDNPDLVKIGVQGFGLAVEVFGAKFSRWFSEWIDRINSIIFFTIEDWKNAGNFEETWELAFISLNTLRKILAKCPKSIFNHNVSPKLWINIVDLLLHPHQWVRRISGDLMSALFVSLDTRTMQVHEKICQSSELQEITLFDSEQNIKRLSRRFCDQLDSDFLDEALAKLIIKNLTFLSKILITYLKPKLEDIVDTPEDAEAEDDDEVVAKPGTGLLWLTKRLAFLARADSSKRNRGTLLVVCF